MGFPRFLIRRRLAGLALVCALCAAMGPLQAAERELPAEPGVPVRVELGAEQPALALLLETKVDVDAVFDGWARVYVTESERRKLERRGFRTTLLPNPERDLAAALREQQPRPDKGSGISTFYHTYATLTADLQAIAAAYPNIARLSSIGQSVQGRELWMMKLSDNPDLEEDEPELSYISSMHGDEVVGKELAYNLIDYLTGNYGTDSRVTDLVDGAEIWIMPSMNPDGTELGQRWNANNVDLNRDFPDQFVDPVNTPAGRQPETAAVMQWAAGRRIIISANFHGGALVANYPFDSNPAGSSTFSPSPDQDEFVVMARTYADHNPPMAVSNSHPAWDNGITNGADWYAVNGGMQDWNYVWNGGFEILMELSSVKWPPGSQLPTFWAENLESMLSYFERGFEGLRGVVTDASTGEPLAATVTIGGNPFPSYTDPDVGDYHRFMVPGTNSVTFAAVGYQPVTMSNVVINSGPAGRVDVALSQVVADLQPANQDILNGDGNGFLDPGEAVDMAVTLNNLGGLVTNVSATLETTGWFASVERPQASYSDIAPGGVGQSRAPHHHVLLSNELPAGHKPGFVLRWQADQASGVTEPFFLSVGAPQCATVDAASLPTAINDFQTTTRFLEFPNDWEIAQVRVEVDLIHTYIGDLALRLTTPGGETLRLHDGAGDTTDDIVGTYGVDLTPADALDTLIGTAAAGTWQFDVTDSGPGDVGTLNTLRLEICGRDFEASPPEMRFAATSVVDGVAIFDWWPYPGLTSYRVYSSTDPSSAADFLDKTATDDDATDTSFADFGRAPLTFYLVTGIGPNGESPKGHFGE